MNGTTSHRWLFLALLALLAWLIWRWYQAKAKQAAWLAGQAAAQAAAGAAIGAASAAADTASGLQGGYMGPYGDPPGQWSDDTLSRVAPETIAAINTARYHDVFGLDGGQLYDAWKFLHDTGQDTASAIQQIATAMGGSAS